MASCRSVAAYIRPQQCDGCCIQKLPYDCASDTKATEQLSNCCSSNSNNRRSSRRSSSSSCFNWKLLRGQVKAHQQQLLPVLLQLHQQQSHTDTHTHKHLHRHSEKSIIVKCSSYVAVVAFNLLARCWQLHHAKATLTTMMKAAAMATGLALDLASASAFLGYFLKLTASA